MKNVWLATRPTLCAPTAPRGAGAALGMELLAAAGAGDEETMAVAGDRRTEVRLIQAKSGQSVVIVH